MWFLGSCVRRGDIVLYNVEIPARGSGSGSLYICTSWVLASVVIGPTLLRIVPYGYLWEMLESIHRARRCRARVKITNLTGLSSRSFKAGFLIL